MPTQATRTDAQRALPWPHRAGLVRLTMSNQDKSQSVTWREASPGRWTRQHHGETNRADAVAFGLTVQQVIAAARAYRACGWKLSEQERK